MADVDPILAGNLIEAFWLRVAAALLPMVFGGAVMWLKFQKITELGVLLLFVIFVGSFAILCLALVHVPCTP